MTQDTLCLSNDLNLDLFIVMIKPPFSVPQCEHLQVIVSKAALSLLRSSASQIVGLPFRPNPVKKSTISQLLKFSQALLTKSNNDYYVLSNYYVVNGIQFQYLFLLVRCGKCAVCRHAKQLDLVNRCIMEASCYGVQPVMVTLTYSNEFLPLNRIQRFRVLNLNTLYYKDVQDFLKRLRIRWTRKGLSHNLRFLCAGEYGKRTQRPHYHLLLFNTPYPSTVSGFRTLYNDIFDSWGMCSDSAFQCEFAGDGAASYCSKYLSKQLIYSRLFDGRASPFIRCSSGHGGIGSPCIDKDSSYYNRNSAIQTYTFRDFSGQVHEIPMTSYVSSRLFPSPSRRLPTSYKLLFRSLVDVLQHLVDYNLMPVNHANDFLSLYSLGILYYVDIKYQSHSFFYVVDLDSVLINVRDRLFDCFYDILDSLDNIIPDIDFQFDAYFRHKSYVVNVNDANINLAFDYQRNTAKVYEQLSKETL